MRLTAVVIGLALAWGVPARASDRAGRIELASTATVYGVGLGVWTSVELDLRPRPTAWVGAALGGGMFYGSWTLANRLELTTADARYVETAGAWSAIDTLLVTGLLQTDGDTMLWSAFGAAAAGAGLALATHGVVRGSEGQISLVNSGGLWTPAAGLLLGATLHLGDGEHIVRDVLVLNLVGLGAGVALSQRYDPTREQVLYMDGGILLGGVSGALLGGIAAAFTDAYEPATALALAGMAGGGWLAVSRYGFDRAGRRRPASKAEALRPMMFPLAAGTF
jgi:hypothetical protein